jgi:hypothetical protein
MKIHQTKISDSNFLYCDLKDSHFDQSLTPLLRFLRSLKLRSYRAFGLMIPSANATITMFIALRVVVSENVTAV